MGIGTLFNRSIVPDVLFCCTVPKQVQCMNYLRSSRVLLRKLTRDLL